MGGKIYETIPDIMSEMNAIGKNRKNTQGQGFMYRGIDDVMNALNPLLTKYRVFIYPEILEQTREERKSSKGSNLIYSICRIKYHVCADDGSSIDSIVVGEGMDSGDKATNKAMSVAFKYLCFQLFCIPTEEMMDPDAESYEVMPRGNNSGSGRPAGNADANNAPIDAAKVNAIREMIRQKGQNESQIAAHYRVRDISGMTFAQWNNAMQILSKCKDIT